ncbi:MAG: Ig-like domain-containing protein [bacterium]
MTPMISRTARMIAVAAALAVSASTVVSAGVPFPPLSTCAITITQFPTRLVCITSWDPDVVRLTPAGSTASPVFDRVSITVRVRDALDVAVADAVVLFSEQSGIVNIANGGATTALTDAAGMATVALHAASGYGRVALCADGVPLCELMVRSPDVNKSGHPTLGCGLSTGSSSVSGSDITNLVCGFLAHFGPVTPGVNDGWDMNCDGFVGGSDIFGGISGRGSVMQYFGDTGTLGATNDCTLP